MPRIHLERRDMGEELRRLFDLLNHQAEGQDHAGECVPPIDVTESPDTIEITVDLPGVAADQVQLAIARGSVLIAGTKRPPSCSHPDATFHLAERAFGRFARVVRLAGAIDAGQARATLRGGELRVVIPRIEERRGTQIVITIESR
jgi:HSP20 family protein